ncbi:uncharacterized protein RHOBADRAFT_51613 [Rhodotorula graminis WP1]|uniref:PIN domain-containing protein n=1 Tax=Rhodotorula graminis (strain WP1) TaxID=578459 RepID=A0A194SBH2_RHOGW|nr:uncharacterized protein RHOBADRAFT_51613 [Rhodotorula graminis WP1]KPV77805.1 hypothetical protein RHOBADRAFT_51613 [Rhodotorula graminis WP1]
MQASVATTHPPAYLHHHSQLAYPHSPAHSRPHSPVPPHLQHQRHQAHPRTTTPSRQNHRSTPPSHSHGTTTTTRQPRSTRPDRDSHHQQQQRYDPDYDRAAASRSTTSLANPPSSSSRELFNPNSHHHHHHQQARRPASPALAPPLDPPSRPRREHRDRSERADRADRDDAGPRTRSKREPVDPADLGRRAGAGSGSGLVAARSGAGAHAHHGSSSRATVAQGSKESLESVETDFSGRTRSSGGGGGTSGRRRRRREDAGGAGDDGDEAADSVAAGLGSVAGASSASRSSRQLFDPRRDDPMRFAEARAERTAARHGGLAKGPAADTRSLASGSVLSFASDMTADDAASASASAASGAAPSASSSKRPPHPAMAPLKRAYREITDLEARVADEHRAAQAASAREGGEADDFAASGAGGGGGAKAGVRIQGAGSRARLDDEFWVRLATLHKQLADAHYSFLQLALDPRLPASLHSLAQRYNIPTRLWQVGFHQLLERMRHAVLSAPLPSSTSSHAHTHAQAHAEDSPPANVLEHLIEFIQHAYGFYSQLFEDPTIAVFRAAWIEQLGDLARYRMAVAGLASRMHAASSSAAPARLTSAALDAHAKPAQQQQRPADAASIGQAALNDWDLEEHETWREMARDWYGQGLAENPGTGRLQHHLALLSKGDEFRALYHYAKSLTATHPYLSARESILPLFEDEHQQRRTQPDVTKAELFVHLHGMLFTKISLDDFSPAQERFLERLKEERWAILKSRDEWLAMSLEAKGDQAPFGDREWFMLGVVNVASLLQYGADDGVLKKLLARDSASGDGGEDGSASTAHNGHGDGGHLSARGSRHGRGGGAGGAGGSSRHASSATLASASAARAAPQAIMVKRSDADDAALDDERTSRGGSSSAASTVGPGFGLGGAEDLVKQLGNGSGGAATLPEDDPLPFKLAQELSFSLLSFLIATPFRTLASSTLALPNPYVTLVLTFVAHLSHHPSALAHLERAIPWAHLASLFNRIPSGINVRLDAPPKLSAGRPLPEDWCLRGMDWAGRQLFARGYWREHRPRAPASPSGDIGGASGEGGAGARVESEMDALRFDMAALDEGEGGGGGGTSSANDEAGEGRSYGVGGGGGAGLSAVARLAEARWRRLAICAAWLVRNVPGFDYDARAVDPSRRFRISGALQRKMERWQREDDDAREAERLSRLALDERRSASAGSAEEDDEESAGEDDDDENDSEAVKELKSRRRQLKAIIRSARSATRGPKLGGRLAARLGGKAASIPKVFAGYTVLVFDTNILLTSIDLFSELVAAECWTIIVPLAVVTELDGLRRNPTALGVAAAEVIDYLELAVRGYSRFLKIQTSRGNYLKDLAIRNESIDFGSSSAAASSSLDGAAPTSSSHDIARSMDDVILRAAAWQRDHFSNRLALVNPQAVLDKRRVPADAAQVVLVTFDRNLRLKAGARGLDATDEKGLKKAVAAAAGFG